jgi:hypothetical protein
MSFQVHASRAGVGMHRPGAFCIGDAPKFLPRAQGRLFLFLSPSIETFSQIYPWEKEFRKFTPSLHTDVKRQQYFQFCSRKLTSFLWKRSDI